MYKVFEDGSRNMLKLKTWNSIPPLQELAIVSYVMYEQKLLAFSSTSQGDLIKC